MKDDDETTNDPEKVTSEKDALKNVPGRGDGLERSIHGQGSGRWWGQGQDAPEKIFSVLGLFNSFLHPCCCCYLWSSSMNNFVCNRAITLCIDIRNSMQFKSGCDSTIWS